MPLMTTSEPEIGVKFRTVQRLSFSPHRCFCILGREVRILEGIFSVVDTPVPDVMKDILLLPDEQLEEMAHFLHYPSRNTPQQTPSTTFRRDFIEWCNSQRPEHLLHAIAGSQRSSPITARALPRTPTSNQSRLQVGMGTDTGQFSSCGSGDSIQTEMPYEEPNVPIEQYGESPGRKQRTRSQRRKRKEPSATITSKAMRSSQCGSQEETSMQPYTAHVQFQGGRRDGMNEYYAMNAVDQPGPGSSMNVSSIRDSLIALEARGLSLEEIGAAVEVLKRERAAPSPAEGHPQSSGREPELSSPVPCVSDVERRGRMLNLDIDIHPDQDTYADQAPVSNFPPDNAYRSASRSSLMDIPEHCQLMELK